MRLPIADLLVAAMMHGAAGTHHWQNAVFG